MAGGKCCERKTRKEVGGGAVVWTWLLNWKWKGKNHVAKRGRAERGSKLYKGVRKQVINTSSLSWFSSNSSCKSLLQHFSDSTLYCTNQSPDKKCSWCLLTSEWILALLNLALGVYSSFKHLDCFLHQPSEGPRYISISSPLFTPVPCTVMSFQQPWLCIWILLLFKFPSIQPALSSEFSSP